MDDRVIEMKAEFEDTIKKLEMEVAKLEDRLDKLNRRLTDLTFSMCEDSRPNIA